MLQEAHKQAPAPASSTTEPSLFSFVEISEIYPSISHSHGSTVDVDNNGKRAPATPQALPAQPKTPKGGYDVAYPDRGTVISRYKEKRKNRR